MSTVLRFKYAKMRLQQQHSSQVETDEARAAPTYPMPARLGNNVVVLLPKKPDRASLLAARLMWRKPEQRQDTPLLDSIAPSLKVGQQRAVHMLPASLHTPLSH